MEEDGRRENGRMGIGGSEDMKMRDSREGDFRVEFGVDPLDLGGERCLLEAASVGKPFPTQLEVGVLVSLDNFYQVHRILIAGFAQLAQ